MLGCAKPTRSRTMSFLFCSCPLPPRSTLFPYTTLFRSELRRRERPAAVIVPGAGREARGTMTDRKSTRLNSSHRCSSYAGLRLKKKTAQHPATAPLAALTLARSDSCGHLIARGECSPRPRGGRLCGSVGVACPPVQRRCSVVPSPHAVARCRFFFARARYPRDLHSFPTRRSSDLSCAGVSVQLPSLFRVPAERLAEQ